MVRQSKNRAYVRCCWPSRMFKTCHAACGQCCGCQPSAQLTGLYTPKPFLPMQELAAKWRDRAACCWQGMAQLVVNNVKCQL